MSYPSCLIVNTFLNIFEVSHWFSRFLR